MNQKAVLLNLRVARVSDFANELGEQKYGCMYFQQAFDESFCNQPYFFHENTDLEVFKELFRSKQIWVLAGIFDEVAIVDKRKPIIEKHKYGRKSYLPKPLPPRPCFCSHKH